METQTLPPLPDTPTIISQLEKEEMTPIHLSESSTTSSPGTTPFRPLSAAEILAQPSGFEAQGDKMITSPSSTSSGFSEASTFGSVSKPVPAVAPTVAAPAVTYEDKQKDAAEEKKTKEWLDKYIRAQPSGTLLKVTDPEYLEIMAVWRKQQESTKVARKELAQMIEKENREEMGKKVKEKKSGWFCFNRARAL